MNEDGNVIGRIGALLVIGLCLLGVRRIQSGALEMCPPEKDKAALSCCAGETKPADAKPAAAEAAKPAPVATPAKH